MTLLELLRLGTDGNPFGCPHSRGNDWKPTRARPLGT